MDAQELADAYATLENNTELQEVVQTLFKDFDGVPPAEYWISFMEMVEVLTQNTHAVRTSNWTEFKSSLKQMVPWIQIYDNEKCGRHLSDFTTALDTLPSFL